MEISKDTTYEDIKNNVNELNQKAWNKILTKQIGQLKSVLENEVSYCDNILYDDCLNNQLSGDYSDIIQNLEALIHDLYQWPENTLNCNFRTLETILKEIKDHE